MNCDRCKSTDRVRRITKRGWRVRLCYECRDILAYWVLYDRVSDGMYRNIVNAILRTGERVRGVQIG